ncbi:hypothetical protein GQ42DRAFT_181430 [Ramicandelaber brevisporus]|nr:hypothetical protein GQ42DRAFT_181430 [Ramicandelaber brevisporus]
MRRYRQLGQLVQLHQQRSQLGIAHLVVHAVNVQAAQLVLEIEHRPAPVHHNQVSRPAVRRPRSIHSRKRCSMPDDQLLPASPVHDAGCIDESNINLVRRPEEAVLASASRRSSDSQTQNFSNLQTADPNRNSNGSSDHNGSNHHHSSSSNSNSGGNKNDLPGPHISVPTACATSTAKGIAHLGSVSEHPLSEMIPGSASTPTSRNQYTLLRDDDADTATVISPFSPLPATTSSYRNQQPAAALHESSDESGRVSSAVLAGVAALAGSGPGLRSQQFIAPTHLSQSNPAERSIPSSVRSKSKQRPSHQMQRHSGGYDVGGAVSRDGVIRDSASFGSGVQRLSLEDDGMDIEIRGYRTRPLRELIYYILCVLTGGVLFLVGRWFPAIWIRMVCTASVFERADLVAITNSWKELSIVNISRRMYNGSIRSVFGADSANNDGGNTNDNQDDRHMGELIGFEYRCLYFILHPLKCEFTLLVDAWRDPLITEPVKSSNDPLRGLSNEMHSIRQLLFGNNEIEIKSRPLLRILNSDLTNENEDSSLFANNNNSGLNGNGKWIRIPSSELVPGDLVQLSEEDSTNFACDMILLEGDCIVNESMLTGESVPVAKLPIDAYQVHTLDFNNPQPPPHVARHILYAGTKPVRIRASHGFHHHHHASNEESDGHADGSNSHVPTVISHPHTRGYVVALVMKTGFCTTKGSLIRSILFPRPATFAFYRDAFRFIGVLACIAVLGFLLSIANFIRLGLPAHSIIVRALDLITIVVPPALPATMSVGMTFALSRLRKQHIYCIAPTRINVGGRVDVTVFDKTGTLTEDGLDVLGIHPININNASFVDIIEKQDHLNRSLRELMYSDDNIGDPLDIRMFEYTNWILEESGSSSDSTNNNANNANNNNINVSRATVVPTVVRPPHSHSFQVDRFEQNMDINSSNIAGGSGEHTPNFISIVNSDSDDIPHLIDAAELGIIRTFEFISSLRRMTVIVKPLFIGSSISAASSRNNNPINSSSNAPTMYAYTKGAPESLISLCLPESIPSDLEETLLSYTKHGYRVLALAGKSLPPSLSVARAMNPKKLSRDDVESNLTFLGLIVFENRVKELTSKVLKELSDANIRRVMCTGDNPVTAISVAKECGIVDSSTQVFVGEVMKSDNTVDSDSSKLIWRDSDAPYSISAGNNSNKKKKKKSNNINNEGDVILDINSSDNIETNNNVNTVANNVELNQIPPLADLAITGDVFRWMIDNCSEEYINIVLVRCQIFARMSPDEKQELVEKLRGLEYCVLFCGDGANDVGALKGADVGLSLSEAEASVAAPFTSRDSQITCVIDVIREGRCALVTSFSCFKFMALYSLIQFISVSLLYRLAAGMADFQFLYIDLFIILPVAVFMGWTPAYPGKLHKIAPTASLISATVLTSLCGQIIIQALSQLITFVSVQKQSWYTPPPEPTPEVIADHGVVIECNENTVLFMVSSFQYILVAIAFSIGAPYRQSAIRNYWFIGSVFTLCCFSGVVLLWPTSILRSWFEMVEIPADFRHKLLAVVLANSALTLLAERFVFPNVAQPLGDMAHSIQHRGFWNTFTSSIGKAFSFFCCCCFSSSSGRSKSARLLPLNKRSVRGRSRRESILPVAMDVNGVDYGGVSSNEIRQHTVSHASPRGSFDHDAVSKSLQMLCDGRFDGDVTKLKKYEKIIYSTVTGHQVDC